MSDLERRYREDKALRDMAKRNVTADMANMRAALSGTSIVNRVTGRVSEGAQDVIDTARTKADGRGGVLAALVGALALWFGYEPLLRMLGLSDARNDDAANATQDARENDPHSGSERTARR